MTVSKIYDLEQRLIKRILEVNRLEKKLEKIEKLQGNGNISIVIFHKRLKEILESK